MERSLSKKEIYGLVRRVMPHDWRSSITSSKTLYGKVGEIVVKMDFSISNAETHVPSEINTVIEYKGVVIGSVSSRDKNFIELYQQVRQDYEENRARNERRNRQRGIDEALKILG